MKNIFKSFTFYFMLLSVLLIYNQYIGYDSKNIILIGLNPMLNILMNMDSFRELVNSGPFIDSNTFMQSKLSDVIDNWSGINSKECKSCMERKKLNQNAILLGLKTMDWITDTKNVKKNAQN